VWRNIGSATKGAHGGIPWHTEAMKGRSYLR